MGETKYGKYFKTEPIDDAEFAPSMHLVGGEIWEGLPFKITLKCISEPYALEEHPHAHDFDQVLSFLGGNPLNFRDFGAEVEIYLGEEHEKHIINRTTILHIPKGLIHCPLVFTKVNKPVMFLNIALTAKGGRSLGPPPKKMIKKY